VTKGTRTLNPQSHSLADGPQKNFSGKDIEQLDKILCQIRAVLGFELAEIAQSWADLPDDIKRSILLLARHGANNPSAGSKA